MEKLDHDHRFLFINEWEIILLIGKGMLKKQEMKVGGKKCKK